MRVLYATADDATKPSAENNGYYIAEALSQAGATLDFVHLRDFSVPEKALIAIRKGFSRMKRQNYRAKADVTLMRRRAQGIRVSARRSSYDLAVTNSGPTIAAANIGLPYAIYTDAPIVALRDMGHYLDDWSGSKVQEYIEIDRIAVQNALVTIYHSRWAAQQAISAYGVDPTSILVVPPGANIPWVPAASADLKKAKGEYLDLLFFGRDWERKGGPRAQRITQQLVLNGVKARLHVCGPRTKPTSTADDPNVAWLPPIDKLDSKELQRLERIMQSTDYLLLPTKADTSTSAIRESSAFGVPSVVTAVGGLVEMVEDGVNGVLIADADDDVLIAERIAQNYANEELRLAWRASARQQYEIDMNWPTAGKRMLTAIRNAIS